MTAGQVAMIYLDVFEKERPEGEARLISKKFSTFDGYEIWDVVFLGEGTVTTRVVHPDWISIK